jgi:hypothetical protein
MGAYNMTKKVTMVFATPATEAWKIAVNQKIHDMRELCQTDGMVAPVAGTPAELGGMREFKDQAAAEAWVAFCNSLSATVGRSVVTSEISNL